MSCGRSPENLVRTFYAVCLSHMQNTAGVPLLWWVRKKLTISSAGFRLRWEVVQQAEAGSNVIIPLRTSQDFANNSTLKTASALITTYCHDIFIGVFYVYVCALLTTTIRRWSSAGYSQTKGNPAFAIKAPTLWNLPTFKFDQFSTFFQGWRLKTFRFMKAFTNGGHWLLFRLTIPISLFI